MFIHNSIIIVQIIIQLIFYIAQNFFFCYKNDEFNSLIKCIIKPNFSFIDLNIF